MAELVGLAESLGATVYHAPMNDRLDFPMDHPSYAGMLAPENTRIRERLDRHDVVLLAGARAFVPHHYSPEPAVGPDTRLVQVDDDPAVIGRNYPVEVGLFGDLRAVLGALGDAGQGHRRGPRRPRRRPGSPGAPGSGLAADPRTRRRHRRRPPARRRGAGGGGDHHRPAAARAPNPLGAGSFQHTVGGGLGWGIGAAVGTALGRPGRRVVAALGDGCAMFGLQGLWTAAREQVPVTFVVFSNGEYRTLKQTLARMRGDQHRRLRRHGLRPPPVDWPAFASPSASPGCASPGRTTSPIS